MGFCANPCSGEDLFGFLLVPRLSSDCKTVKLPCLQTENLKIKTTTTLHYSLFIIHSSSFVIPILSAFQLAIS